MEISKDLKKKFSKPPKPDSKLHSPNHILAEELSIKMGEPKRFGFYLKMAITHDHNVLRRIAGGVAESKAKNPGALFAYLIKKENTPDGTADSKISE